MDGFLKFENILQENTELGKAKIPARVRTAGVRLDIRIFMRF